MRSTLKFTKKENAFIKYYALYGVGGTAALKAGYNTNNPNQIAYKLLTKPHIIKAVKKEQDKISKKFDMTADQVLKQYQNLATADINDYYETNYYLKTGDDGRTKTLLSTYKGNIISQVEYELLKLKHRSYYEPHTRLKDFTKLTKGQRAAIEKITYDKFGNAILHLSNRTTSLDAIAKYHGIFEKDNKQKSTKVNVDNRSLNDFYGENIKSDTGEIPLNMKLH